MYYINQLNKETEVITTLSNIHNLRIALYSLHKIKEQLPEHIECYLSLFPTEDYMAYFHVETGKQEILRQINYLSSKMGLVIDYQTLSQLSYEDLNNALEKLNQEYTLCVSGLNSNPVMCILEPKE